MSSEKYKNHEQIKSLYDCSQGAYMTSKIGDLPLTVEGLRKAVDEITRLNNVEAELQELNMKYYNEAKDLRRELAKAKAENEKRLKANEDFAAKHCYMKCDIAKILVKEFAEKLKEEVVCNLCCKGTNINNAEEIKACTAMAKQLLYQINRHLNEDYGFDEPLCARDQFKVEPNLIKKYKIDELLEEYLEK